MLTEAILIMDSEDRKLNKKLRELREQDGFFMGLHKVTSASIGTTKRGYSVYRLQLDHSIHASKFVETRPKWGYYSNLHELYVKNGNSIEFLIGKYIYVELKKNDYGYEIGKLTSMDVATDFNDALISSEGRPFEVISLPIYELLTRIKRPVEEDGSIKLKTNFGDMRISIVNGFTICHEYNPPSSQLNFTNINQIFNEYYKDVSLGPEPVSGDPTQRSYYAISDNGMRIIQMVHEYYSSRKDSNRHDYNFWKAHTVVELGDQLTDEHPEGIGTKKPDDIDDIFDAF